MTKLQNKAYKQGDRLFRIRKSLINPQTGKSLTQTEFGKGINYGRDMLTRWENGIEPIPDEIYPVLEAVYRINPNYLRNGEGDMFLTPMQRDIVEFTEAGKAALETAIPTKQSKITDLKYQVVNIINKSHNHPGINVWAIAGMGGGYFNPEEHTEPIEKIEVTHLLNHKYRDAFRAWGQSMMPVIRHNALCFCDFNDRTIRSEEIYIFNLPSVGLVVKELRIEKEAGEPPRFIIYSYNANPEYYSKEELAAENFIVGRVTLIHQETNK